MTALIVALLRFNLCNSSFEMAPKRRAIIFFFFFLAIMPWLPRKMGLDLVRGTMGFLRLIYIAAKHWVELSYHITFSGVTVTVTSTTGTGKTYDIFQSLVLRDCLCTKQGVRWGFWEQSLHPWVTANGLSSSLRHTPMAALRGPKFVFGASFSAGHAPWCMVPRTRRADRCLS